MSINDMGANLGGVYPPNNSAASPNIFMLHISEVDGLFLWSSLHFGQEIGHLGSDDLFYLVFTSWHFTVVGKNLGNSAGVVKFSKSSSQSREMTKNGRFCRIIPPPQYST